MLDVITIGDCMLDIFLQIHEASVTCRKDHCLLCLEYGEKIPVQAMTSIAGCGNASNAAIGASRLGMKAAIVSIIGNDEVGNQIKRTWKQEGVQTPYVTIDKKHETSLSTVLRFQGDRTILVYNQPRTYRLPTLATSAWIYYTALGPGHEPLEKSLLQHLKQHPEIQLVTNPGPHQIRRGRTALTPLIRRSNLFVVNKEEAAQILNTKGTPVSLLKKLLTLGATRVAITDGPNGAWAGDEGGIWYAPSLSKNPIDSTGAGDSFATGMMYALSQQLSLKDALLYGGLNAQSVIHFVGPHAGLLKKAQLAALLKNVRHSKPRLVTA